MEQYLKSVLGCSIQKETYKLPDKMPQYLLNDYSYQKYIIENQECLFVIPFDFSLTTYKKQREKIKQITNLPVVLQLKNITQYQRKTLLNEHIPFIVENSQIYIPFLAISLTEKFYEIKEIEKFTPITQLVFLYLFYFKDTISATDLAAKINCSAMSVSRAYKVLTDSGLFRSEEIGTKKYILQNYDDGELLKEAEQFFMNPVEKTIYLNNSTDLPEYIESGIYALGKKTMLNATDSDKCYAVFKKTSLDLSNHISRVSYIAGDGFKVEKWVYDPSILS